MKSRIAATAAATLLLFLVLVQESAAQAGLFTSKGPVKLLDALAFKKHLKAQEKATVAAFTAPWCGYCKQLKPEFEKAASNLKGLVDFVNVDCDEDKNKPLCSEYGVQGFPTIKFFGGAPKNSPRDYQGARTAKAMVDHALDRMPSFVKPIKAPELLKLLEEKKLTKPTSILLTTSSRITPLYKGLSTDFHSDIVFHAAKDDGSKESNKIKEILGMDKVPGVVLYKPDGEIDKYSGPFKYDSLYAFLLKSAKGGSKAKDEL